MQSESNGETPPSMVTTQSRHPALKQLDPQTAFLYTPRTVTFLLCVVGALLILSGTLEDVQEGPEMEMDLTKTTQNAKRGVWTVIFVFLGYSIVQGPTTSMVRPHPTFWRLIHGICVVYFLFVVWILFQDLHTARQFMKHLSEELGTELPERAYGEDCSLSLENLRETIFDEFVLAHVLGWWGKSMMIRHTGILWVLSIAFEIMELTFQHWLPNFNECWWDSWILDVAVCNYFGIHAGMWTVRLFDCRYEKYNWMGISQQKTIIDKARRSFQQLLPYSWDKYRWNIDASPKRCAQVSVLIVWILAVEVQAFFLKYILWIPPRNLLNTYRLIIWFALGLPAVREYFEFLEGRPVGESLFPKLGPFAWLGAATALVEFLVCWKFGRRIKEFRTPFPFRVVCFWSVLLGFFFGTLLIWQIRIWLKSRTDGKLKAA